MLKSIPFTLFVALMFILDVVFAIQNLYNCRPVGAVIMAFLGGMMCMLFLLQLITIIRKDS